MKHNNRIYTVWEGNIGIYIPAQCQGDITLTEGCIFTNIARPISIYSVYYTKTATYKH